MKKVIIAILIIFLTIFAFSQTAVNIKKADGKTFFSLENNKIFVKLEFRDNRLFSEEYGTKKEYANKFGSTPFKLKTDGNFKINLMWTGWQAPKFVNNSENPVEFTKDDFKLKDYKIIEYKDGSKELILSMEMKIEPEVEYGHFTIMTDLTYKILPDKFYIKKRISVYDIKRNLHFLRKIYTINSSINSGDFTIIKKGGYGQPIAITMQSSGGLFAGIEYPSSYNKVEDKKISCWQWIGEKIGKTPINSDWTVIGISPNSEVKNFFFNYIDDIRVVKLKPYLLYNSWYDLRAPEMVKNKKNIMNEENTKRIIKLFNENLTKKYGVKLNAFVLDDGWDIYKSDWKLSKEQFPNGLKPISDELKKTGTSLGIWFGPIGGYSHRMWRLNWMKEHGYETVGTQLCFGGKNYSSLFEKRALDFIKDYNVGYYKWDGFQFSCSEKGHGHPIGVYSRRFILNKLIKIANATRKANPDVFLNITSGTWLSPWWVKIANQIWMQGGDYGYSNVPSISKRDSAMTYRDLVLYEDFKKYNFWFPVANLMTHGIIKGDLQKLGGEKEDIEKFTNNAVLYFARGISMYELYITPDLLTEEEWKAIVYSYKWGVKNFDILTASNEMIGGDPGKREIYGYIHYKNGRGIIALRNPSTEKQKIRFELKKSYGFSKNLVLEKIYPYHYVSPVLYSIGDSVEIELSGYETAVFEIFPKDNVNYPLLSNIIYQIKKAKGKNYEIIPLKSTGVPKILNPSKVKYIKFDKKKVNLKNIVVKERDFLDKSKFIKNGETFNFEINFKSFPYEPVFAVLFKTNKNVKVNANTEIKINGKEAKISEIKGRTHWKWVTLNLNEKANKLEVSLDKKDFTGKVSFWIVYKSLQPYNIIKIKTRKKFKEKPNLFTPFGKRFLKMRKKIGEIEL